MNYFNYDRLVQHLRTCDPTTFAYGVNGLSSRANCVACHIVTLVGDDVPAEWRCVSGDIGSAEAICQFLEVSYEETSYLYGSLDSPLNESANQTEYLFCQLRADAGIAEALRRLAIVAARYPRPQEAEAPKLEVPAFQPNEQAFLDSIRSLVASNAEVAS